MNDRDGVNTVQKVHINNDKYKRLNELIDHPESLTGRPILCSIVDKVTHGKDHMCSVCGVHYSLTSFHKTKVKRWKDGRVCIESFPIHTCHSIGCMRHTDEIERKLSKQYGKYVVDTLARSELRMCVGCKQLLHSAHFDKYNWNHFDRRCSMCDTKLFVNRSRTHLKRSGAALLPFVSW